MKTEKRNDKYIVMLVGRIVEEKYLYHYFKDAFKKFEELKQNLAPGKCISIYDMQRDERKAFYKN